MNIKFAESINPNLEKFLFAKALDIAETALRKLPVTGFHAVLGRSLIDQAEELSVWIDNFYRLVSDKTEILALYFEMNEFDINTDYWYIDGFAYSRDGGNSLDDMGWLAGYEADTQTETGSIFVVEGLEEIQTAFSNFTPENNDLQDARDWCEQIVIVRFMELIRTSHLIAKQKQYGWATIPIYFTEHSYDFIVKSDT